MAAPEEVRYGAIRRQRLAPPSRRDVTYQEVDSRESRSPRT